MADKKISQLTALSAANVAPATDVLAIVDTSATETKKITAKDLIDGALNGGTANGVLYLNGSKVATSGSALVFDGTNLGLGVTPSAWSSPDFRGLQVGSGIALFGRGSGDADRGGLVANAYNDGAWKYIATGNATRYEQSDGSHAWYTAASGTAGNTISFGDPKMTLDASGNLIGGGKTSASLTTAGFELTSDGSLRSTKSSTNTNVATNNGGSLQLANSSATDGNFSNIGAYNSNGLVVSQIDFINVSHASRTGDIAFLTHNGSSLLERARITSGGDFLVAKTSADVPTVGTIITTDGRVLATTGDADCMVCNRQNSDGTLMEFRQANTTEGTISVSGNTVSYNAFAGSHWSQLQDGSKPDILRGTVMESINELCVWPGEQNERLPKSKISDTAGSKKVYGVFMAWDNDWTTTNDMYITAVGAFICRVNGSVTVQEGDLLESNGDGTARVQADDIIRSSTIGKVTSTVKTHEYDDGSYCVPTVLYCG